MNRRGFALLSVLWIITTLAAVAGGSLALARTGAQASRNRILLTRAGWAREACMEILLGQYAQSAAQALAEKLDGLVPALDSVDLGRGAWCRVTLDDPSSHMNLNLADASQLRAALGNDSLVDALLDWRDSDDITRPAGAEGSWYRAHDRVAPRNGPFASVEELGLVRGFDSLAQDRLFTTRGNGAVNLTSAPALVIRATLQLPEETVAMLMHLRSAGRPVTNVDQLLALAAPPARQALSARYQDLIQRTTFSPSEIVAFISGHVGNSQLRATLYATMVPLPERLAVIRRETE
jgi:general secretion pathway protein K